MTSEQLQSARAERWRQVSNPILTADDARAWVEGVGLCLFLPRRSPGAAQPQRPAFAPAPSFVEAVAGGPSEAPLREAIENATALLHRLAAEGAVVPLNLSGTAGAFSNGNVGNGTAGASDQPDFLVTREALPYVFSLIGGRNWKSGPGGKATPLMMEIWTLLNNGGPRAEGALTGQLTAQEIQTALGREVTEAAVLRGLLELWHGLRVIPVYDGATTRWELTQARFAEEMAASQKVAQTTALSALVSLYLEAAIAASSEDVETFLSPLTARSRVREVVNGLLATRQLGLISVGAQPLVHVAGSLPEFADAEPATGVVRREISASMETRSAASGFPQRPRETRERDAVRKPHEGGGRGYPSRSGERGRGPDRSDRGRGAGENRGPRERTGFGRPQWGRTAAGGGSSFRPKAGGEQPYRKPEEGERKPYGKKPFEKSAKPFGARRSDAERGGERGERRSGAGGGKFPPKKFGASKPWQDRGERFGAKRPAAGGERPAAGGERPFRPRDDKERPDERGGGERRPGKKFGGAKFTGRRGGFGQRGETRGPRKEGSGGERPALERAGRSFGREKAGEKRPFFREREREGGERRSSEPRAGTAGPQKRAGGWKPKGPGGGFAKRGNPEAKGNGDRGAGRAGDGERPEFRREGRSQFKSGGRPGSSRPGKAFGKSAKPFGKSARPGGGSARSFGGPAKPPGRPAFGKGKPKFGAKKPGGPKAGGARPPFRKRRDEGGENAG